jgi:hypothetical protein
LTLFVFSTFQNIGNIFHAKKKCKIQKIKTTIVSKGASNTKIFAKETLTSSKNLYILTNFTLLKLKGQAWIIKTRNL